MGNAISTLILLGITIFVLNLFPFFRDFTSDIRDDINEKKDNVVEEYERVKGEVEEITDKVNDTKEKVETTVNAVGEAVDKASDALDTVNEFLGDDEEDEEESDEESEETEEVEQEPWRTSDPEIDPSIEAGRNNYNYADPGEDGLAEAHLHADIKPWIEWGNSPDDETSKEDRIAAMAITEKGREILDILGYEYETPEE